MKISQQDFDVINAYLSESHSHRVIERKVLGLPQSGNWDGTKAKDYLWKFGLTKEFKNFLVDTTSEENLEKKIKAYEDAIKKNKIDKDLLREIWRRSQNVYIFQRVVFNSNSWTRPSEGRLGFTDDGEYLETRGFGHEDWNFNLDLTVDGYVYGYIYQPPAKHKQLKN